MDDKIINDAVSEIAKNHRKIIDDWCKAYMAQLYQEGVIIKPGCFTLNEQVPTFHQEKDCMVKKYWFEPGIPEFKKFIEIEDSVDITDEVATLSTGELAKLLIFLDKNDFKKIYFDGYDAAIYVYRKRKEEIE